MFTTELTVRGYELDSYGHVNNAVYLNYLEHARWDIIDRLKILDELKKKDLSIVIAEVRIRYMRETLLFDHLIVETNFRPEPPYLVFYQKIRNGKSKLLVTKAIVKTIFINKNKIPQDIPEIFKQNRE